MRCIITTHVSFTPVIPFQLYVSISTLIIHAQSVCNADGRSFLQCPVAPVHFRGMQIIPPTRCNYYPTTTTMMHRPFDAAVTVRDKTLKHLVYTIAPLSISFPLVLLARTLRSVCHGSCDIACVAMMRVCMYVVDEEIC